MRGTINHKGKMSVGDRENVKEKESRSGKQREGGEDGIVLMPLMWHH